MLVIAALQENQGQPIKASHIVTDVYIKKSNQGGREITEVRLNIQREAVPVGMRSVSLEALTDRIYGSPRMVHQLLQLSP